VNKSTKGKVVWVGEGDKRQWASTPGAKGTYKGGKFNLIHTTKGGGKGIKGGRREQSNLKKKVFKPTPCQVSRGEKYEKGEKKNEGIEGSKKRNPLS